jgi:1-acyl-sn-glycerol-3-phosphate acyltransferase
MGAVRGGAILAAFFGFTLPLMPVQAALVRLSRRWARAFPHWYHRRVCRLLGLRIEVDGEVAKSRPVLLVANHTSWLDIPVLSAVAPVSFVAKKEVGAWPFVASLARLQRSVFVDRTRRSAVREAAGEILSRLAEGDTIVLFAEGTSSDGNRVLPFLTSLFAAAKPGSGSEAPDAFVQTLSLVYTRLHGIPLGRADRPLVGWYGDMEMRGHAWRLLKAGPLDVRIRIGAPVPLASFADRKELAQHSEREVREHVVRILRAKGADEPLAVVAPPAGPAPAKPRRLGEPAKWV